MNEQELQEFLDQIMRESAAKHHVPQHIVEDVLQSKETEAADELTPEFPASDQPVEPVEPEKPDDISPDDAAETAEPQSDDMSAAAVTAHPLRDGIAGSVLVLLAAVGIIGLVQCGIFWGKRLSEEHTDPRIEQVQAAVLPLVLTDQANFDSPDDLTDEQFLTAAVWMLIADGKLGDYPQNFEMRVIPAADVTAAGNRRFGTSRQPEYKTIGFTSDLRFYYDKETGSYLVPDDPQLFTYIPEITALTDTETGVDAEVRYLAEQPAWKHAEPSEVKSVRYSLTKSGENWQIRQVHQTGVTPE